MDRKKEVANREDGPHNPRSHRTLWTGVFYAIAIVMVLAVVAKLH